MLRVRGHDIGAFAANLAAVEIEVDGALGEQTFLRPRHFSALARIADTGAVGIRSRRLRPRLRPRLRRVSGCTGLLLHPATPSTAATSRID